MYKNFSELKTRSTSTLVVAAAHDEHTLQAIQMAERELSTKSILIGNSEKIKSIAFDLKMELDSIIHAETDEDSAKIAVKTVREAGGVLVKGLLETPTLLRAVLDKENGIRDSATMSHAAILEIPGYHKLVTVTDGGMCAIPTYEQKIDIINNTTKLYRRLGFNSAKVAVLAASESVNPKIPESIDADNLRKHCEAGNFGGCIVEGPLSFDLAVSQEAAKIKNFKSQVSGDVDILLVPGVAAGNILCKGLIHWGGAKMAGAVLGAKVPIVLVSRAAEAEEKLLSIAICL